MGLKNSEVAEALNEMGRRTGLEEKRIVFEPDHFLLFKPIICPEKALRNLN
jgi:UV DNA damage repair endonuclease